ncbi:MAG: aminoglycoside phosphotransferase family protein [Oscillospiraceae bacterium]|nr:aminoglycoside phosphotransferase family protein [Oscillospiraceae bacterium]
MDIIEIARKFAIDGEPFSASPIDGGHINDTYCITTSRNRYIFQRINRRVMNDPPLIMENIAAVTAHLHKKGIETLTIVPPLIGGLCLLHDGEYYRMYDYIEGAESRLSPPTAEDFRAAGEAFGSFIEALSDLHIEKVNMLPLASHDTGFHLSRLKMAIEADRAGRVRDARKDIELALSKAGYADIIRPRIISGEIPVRTVHNDSKYSNIIVDTGTHQAKCILDLDNVMPGSLLTDYGDAIRSGCDDNGRFKADLLPPFRDGFLSAVHSITPAERELLPIAPLIITYENAIRYLADYLSGDVYFKTDYPGHNLNKFRMRMRLLADMEDSEGIKIQQR